MGTVALVLILIFVLMLVMNVPIAVSIGLASFFAMIAYGVDPATEMMANKMANGVNSFALLAIPFFILSGHLMGRGGLARRLIDFAATLVGALPGGLGYVNTLTCMLFGSISGSAAAAVSSVGGFMIPEMNRKGYDREFNVSVTTTAATTGLLIPPSNVMIVYSVAAGTVSIAAMFMAGIFPGIITGLFIMLVAGIISLIRGYRGDSIELPRWKPITACGILAGIILFSVLSKMGWVNLGFSIGEVKISNMVVWFVIWSIACCSCFITFRRAYLTLLLIVVVIGGILGGVFTATEAAAVAVVYAFILSVLVYREVKFSELSEILLHTGITTAIVMLLIGASSCMSWIMVMADIPQTVSAALLGLSDNPIVILLTINVLLLFVGTFMDMTPAILIFTPIFLPVVTSDRIGMDPVHFGIMLIANLCIGLCTPPVGTCLFIGCGVGKTTIAKITKTLLPFFGSMVAALLVITYIPAISLWLPVQTRQLKEEDVKYTFLKKQIEEKPVVEKEADSSAPTDTEEADGSDEPDSPPAP